MTFFRWFVKPKHRYRVVGAILAAWLSVLFINKAISGETLDSLIGYTVPVGLIWIVWWVIAAAKREGDIRWCWKVLYRGAAALLVIWFLLMMTSLKLKLGWFDADDAALFGSAWKLWCVWWVFVAIVRQRRKRNAAIINSEKIEPDAKSG